MATRGWTSENLRHLAGLFRQGANPAAAVYDSIGPDFFLALSPGWLNLGLWEGDGDAAEAPIAVRRLVEPLERHVAAQQAALDRAAAERTALADEAAPASHALAADASEREDHDMVG